MSNEATKKMLSMYEDRREPTLFLASFFQSPRENFFNSETVEIDVRRYNEKVAIVVTDLSTGFRINTRDPYTNKEFKPPLFKEAFKINEYDMIKRQPGQDPFQDPAYMANAMQQFAGGMVEVSDLINRAVEWQASQVMQTGTLTLVDEDGNAAYTIDFKPKATHFPTAGTAWNAASPTILADLESLMDVIRDDGKRDPGISIWGIDSYNAALNNDDFRQLFDTRRIDAGAITRMRDMGQGGKFRGTLDVGNYPLEIWTYNGRFEHPSTGNITKFIAGDKVVILGEDSRLDLVWGNVPKILPPEQRVQRFASMLPNRIRQPGRGGTDMITSVWTTDSGDHLFGGISARPLAIPTGIDTIGCLDTGV
jgi:hypothetical protein